MVRKNFTLEQIINKLKEAEVHISQGIPIAEASRKIGVTGQTYYRWRKEYGGEEERMAAFENLVSRVESADSLQEDDLWRIFPVKRRTCGMKAWMKMAITPVRNGANTPGRQIYSFTYWHVAKEDFGNLKI